MEVRLLADAVRESIVGIVAKGNFRPPGMSSPRRYAVGRTPQPRTESRQQRQMRRTDHRRRARSTNGGSRGRRRHVSGAGCQARELIDFIGRHRISTVCGTRRLREHRVMLGRSSQLALNLELIADVVVQLADPLRAAARNSRVAPQSHHCVGSGKYRIIIVGRQRIRTVRGTRRLCEHRVVRGDRSQLALGREPTADDTAQLADPRRAAACDSGATLRDHYRVGSSKHCNITVEIGRRDIPTPDGRRTTHTAAGTGTRRAREAQCSHRRATAGGRRCRGQRGGSASSRRGKIRRRRRVRGRRQERRCGRECAHTAHRVGEMRTYISNHERRSPRIAPPGAPTRNLVPCNTDSMGGVARRPLDIPQHDGEHKNEVRLTRVRFDEQPLRLQPRKGGRRCRHRQVRS